MIDAVDWTRFDGPPMYDSEKVPPALHALVNLETSESTEDVGNRLVYAIGNDHAGVYYPAVLEALDIIAQIEQTTTNNARKTCAYAVLNDLYYFEPDTEGYEGYSPEKLKIFVKEKLAQYSDD